MEKKLDHIDLCSGIGGFGYAFETVGLSRPVLFCEIDHWCRKVLKKHWPDVPIAEDVKELANDPDRYVSRNLDWGNTILSAGYPCQPFSVAGKQKGTEDPRHIWPWIVELVALKRPKFAVFENVTGHIALGLDKVIHDLEGEDYAVTTLIIPASVFAPHKRERLWIIAANMADTNDTRDRASEHETDQGRQTADQGRQEQPQLKSGRQSNDVADTQSSKRWPRQEPKQQKGDAPRQPISNGSGNVADTDNEGSQRGVQGGQNTQRQGVDGLTRCSGATHGQPEEREQTTQPRMGDLADGLSSQLDRFGKHDGFEVEPGDIPRVASGIKDRANRLKGLGNAIVPQIAMQLALAIKETQ